MIYIKFVDVNYILFKFLLGYFYNTTVKMYI